MKSRISTSTLLRNLKKKLWNMKVTIIPIVIGALGIVTKRMSTRNGGLENKRTRGDHPSYCIIEISQITKKSPGDKKKLVVTQTPVRKKHQVTLV